MGVTTTLSLHVNPRTRFPDDPVLQDPRERPDGILADFETDNPLATFGSDDVPRSNGLDRLE
jgi:hypothetical protein